jgi:type I restriction enzyme M protein
VPTYGRCTGDPFKDDALDDPDLLPPQEEVAAEIVENLDTALERFRRVANGLGRS